jgi:spore coat polysaccharide biosynthesis predicted glycosyltransferase SpsG
MLDTEAGTLAYVAGFGPRVITLDDRGEGRVDADGIINFLVRESDRASLRNGTMLWEGPEYATLDPAFETPPPPGRDASTSRATLLVSVGGGDAAGLSLKIARALTALPGIAVVTFVCGAASGRAEQLGSIVKSAPWRGRVLCDLPNLREALLACDLAIVAGGMTMHEACCTGTPALAVCQPIDHQIELARWFDEAGAMRTLGDGTRASEGDITRATRCLLADGEKLRQMSEAGPRLVDGRGTSRTAAAITAAARRVRTGGQG